MTRTIQQADVTRRTFVQLAAATGALMALGPAHAQSEPIVETTEGRVRGARSGEVSVFRGVPYAGPTKGRRFQPPSTLLPWSGIRDALQPGAYCPQDQSPGQTIMRSLVTPGAMDEDCLFLDIWTPEANRRRRRPVMFWMHGGGFEAGAGSSNWYDGTRLASLYDVVVITVTHRLNVFGYLYLGELGGERLNAANNVGMLDLVAALTWVRNNIDAFGGDPQSVTIFGASGGAGKVGTLMAMPTAQRLFHRAIAQSGPALRMLTPDAATRSAVALLDQLQINRNDIGRLANWPAREIVAAREKLFGTPGISFRPVVDNRSLPRHPFDPDAPNVSADVPMMIGFTGTETTHLLAAPENFALDDAALRTKLTNYVPPARVDELIALARDEEPRASPSDVFFRLTTDAWYRAPSAQQAERKTAQGKGASYMYVTEWRTPVENGKWRSPHVVDLPLFFDNVDQASSMVGDGAGARHMAAIMSKSWTAFATSGDPTFDPQLRWPRYEPAARTTMLFNEQSKIVNDPRGAIRRVLSG